MQVPRNAMLLRIFMGESDRWSHQPLSEAIVMSARKQHLAGATVLRGPMGYGRSSRVHTAKLIDLSADLPIVVEIVDSEENIGNFLPILDEMLSTSSGLVTIERVQTLRYGDAPIAPLKATV